MRRTTTKKWAARGAILSLLAGGMAVAAVGPAAADDFTPGNTAPTAAITTGDPMGTVTPTATGSDLQLIEVLAGDADLLQDLATVELCLYRTGVGDATCAATDPQNTVSITWTRATDAFTMDPDAATTWALGTSVSNYNAAATSMAMDFEFRAGAVSLEGDWTVIATATDVSDDDGIDNNANMMPVGYFSTITAQRLGVSYGEVDSGAPGAATSLDDSDGTIIANGATDVSMSQDTEFEMTVPTLNTAGIAGGTPATAVGTGDVALDCEAADTFTEGNATRLTLLAQTLDAGVLTSGTPEAGTTALVNSCRLTSGGGLPIGEYSATVAVGVGNAA